MQIPKLHEPDKRTAEQLEAKASRLGALLLDISSEVEMFSSDLNLVEFESDEGYEAFDATMTRFRQTARLLTTAAELFPFEISDHDAGSVSEVVDNFLTPASLRDGAAAAS